MKYKYTIFNPVNQEVITGSNNLGNARRKLESNVGCVIQYSAEAIADYVAEKFENSTYFGAKEND